MQMTRDETDERVAELEERVAELERRLDSLEDEDSDTWYDVDAAGGWESTRFTPIGSLSETEKAVYELLGQMEQEYDDYRVPADRLMEAAREREGISERDFEEAVDKLKSKGEVYVPLTGVLSIT